MKTNRKTDKIKHILYVAVLLILFLPMLQQKFNFIEIAPLKGSFESVSKPILNSENWLSGQYNKEQQDYINQNFGFRNIFVRLYNQIQFTFYNKANAKGVVIGKDDYLYEENYITAHLGRDFIGKEVIENRVKKLKRISEHLKKKNIQIIVVLAPGKASFYPEFIPSYYNTKNVNITNYEVYKASMLKEKINLLDFHHWFRQMKKTSKYPLFPKTGIHWSKYGEILATDSIIKYVNSLHKEKQSPLYNFTSIENSFEMRDTDDDVEQGLNLILNIEDLKMAYPSYEIEKISTKEQLKVLTISDSYYWGIFNMGCSRDVFNKGQFWFYNQQIYPDSYEQPITVDEINLIKEVEKNDVIILMSTDANLSRFAFGFINKLYNAYF